MLFAPPGTLIVGTAVVGAFIGAKIGWVPTILIAALMGSLALVVSWRIFMRKKAI